MTQAAAGATKIEDSDAFHKLAMAMRHASGPTPQDAYRAMTAFINNALAQEREQALADQMALMKKCCETDQAEFNRKWTEQKDRAEAAEASLALMVEALTVAEAALADIGDADREPGDDLAWCEARAARALPAVRALLPAKAETPKCDECGMPGMHKLSCSQRATTAMGEELPPLPGESIIPIDQIPEGCTPADARILRDANFQLAVENNNLHAALDKLFTDGRACLAVSQPAPVAAAAATDHASRSKRIASVMCLIQQDYSAECVRAASTYDYVVDAVGQLVDAGVLVTTGPLAAPAGNEQEMNAARYIFLRDTAIMGYPSSEGSRNKDAYLVVTGYGYADSKDTVDTAVDTARAAQQKGST